LAYSFKISIDEELSTTLKKVEDAIVENGGEFKGDTTSGEFSGKTILGKVKGEYNYNSDDQIEITITKKPFAVPKSKIESAIREYFA